MKKKKEKTLLSGLGTVTEIKERVFTIEVDSFEEESLLGKSLIFNIVDLNADDRKLLALEAKVYFEKRLKNNRWAYKPVTIQTL